MAKVKTIKTGISTVEFFCDRCEAKLSTNYVDSRKPAIEVTVRGMGERWQWKDLCEDCIDEILDILDEQVFIANSIEIENQKTGPPTSDKKPLNIINRLSRYLPRKIRRS